MVERLVGRVRRGRMLQFVERKTLTWVADIINYAPRRPDVAEIHGFVRVQVTTMLDGVHQQLPECGRDLLAFARIQVARQLSYKLRQVVGCRKFATDLQRNPVRTIR